jgi:hypothetical protein
LATRSKKEGLVVLESARTRENRRRAREASEPSLEEGLTFRAARRSANRRKAAAAPGKDAQNLLDFEWECVNGSCERWLRVPLYVYERVLEAEGQYLLQTGHHASPRYRTIVPFAVTTIEEQI